MRKNLLRKVSTPTIASMAYASAKYAELDWINGKPADAENMLRAAWHYLQAIKGRNEPDAGLFSGLRGTRRAHPVKWLP